MEGKRKGNTYGEITAFLFKASIFTSLLFLISKQFGHDQFWFVVLSVFLLSIPIALGGFYISTIKKINKLHIFGTKGWIFKLLSQRTVLAVAWLAWSLFSALFMLIQFQTYTKLEWLVFFLVIPVFWLTFSLVKKILSKELKPYILIATALDWTKWLCPLIMLLIYLTVFSLHENPTIHPSLNIAIDAKKQSVSSLNASAIVQEAAQLNAIYMGSKEYILGNLSSRDAFLALLASAFGTLVIFLNVCIFLSCLIIPSTEYRRIFGPLTDANTPEPISVSRMIYISGVTTFITLFVYIPLFSYFEIRAQNSLFLSKPREVIEYVVLRLEKIGEEFYREGTAAKINDIRISTLAMLDSSIFDLENHIDVAFDKMENNVDGFLDWYYSLFGGEYARIGHLLVNNLDTFLIEKLNEHLEKDNPFEGVEAAINELFAKDNELKIAFQQAAHSILEQNRVSADTAQIEIISEFSLEDIIRVPVHQDIIDLRARLITSGGGALMSAVVAKKVAAKAAGKSSMKLAGKALGKALGKIGAGYVGGKAGAITGAAVGSLFPGIGNVAGAIIGGVAGAFVGVTFDKTLLVGEELLSRKKFKDEIIMALHDTRDEFKNTLRGQ